MRLAVDRAADGADRRDAVDDLALGDDDADRRRR
jgi:hypothetical protein